MKAQSNKPWLWPAAVFSLGLLPSCFGLLHGFYTDDFLWLEKAQYSLNSPSYLNTIWAEGFFRPIAQLWFFSEFLLFRFNSIGYNLMAVILHAGVGYSLWGFVSRIGLSNYRRACTVLLFLVGAGHFTKPVSWASSQAILLGAIFTLWAANMVLFPEPAAKNSRQVLLGFIFSVLAMLTHDLYALFPLALCVAVFVVGHPRRRFFTLSVIPASILYFAVSLKSHSSIEMETAGLLQIFQNLAQYSASLLGPFVSLPVIRKVLDTLGMSEGGQLAAWIIILSIGTLTFIAMFTQVLDLGRMGWASFIIAMALLLPALSIVNSGGWINARYIYPSSIFFCLFLSGLIRYVQQSGGQKIALLLFVFWYLSLFSGSVFMQQKAINAGATEESRQMYDKVRGVEKLRVRTQS